MKKKEPTTKQKHLIHIAYFITTHPPQADWLPGEATQPQKQDLLCPHEAQALAQGLAAKKNTIHQIHLCSINPYTTTPLYQALAMGADQATILTSPTEGALAEAQMLNHWLQNNPIDYLYFSGNTQTLSASLSGLRQQQIIPLPKKLQQQTQTHLCVAPIQKSTGPYPMPNHRQWIKAATQSIATMAYALDDPAPSMPNVKTPLTQPIVCNSKEAGNQFLQSLNILNE